MIDGLLSGVKPRQALCGFDGDSSLHQIQAAQGPKRFESRNRRLDRNLLVDRLGDLIRGNSPRRHWGKGILNDWPTGLWPRGPV